MTATIKPEHRRREREQAERQLIEQVMDDVICVPGKNRSSLFDVETLADVRRAHTRLRGYQIMLVDSDVLLLLGHQNDNLVALTLGLEVSSSTPARLHPLLRQTLCLHYETHRTLLFRLDGLAVPEFCSVRGITFRSRGTEPLVFRNRFASPLLAVTGSLPVRLPVVEIAWGTAFGSRAETFGQPQRDWLGEESTPARTSSPPPSASDVGVQPQFTPPGR